MIAWAVSVAAVIVSGLVALAEGNWRKRPFLDIGFSQPGGMWGDAALASAGLHGWWHGATPHGVRDQMWPTRPTGRWAADLSRSLWCHVVYVTGELALPLAYAASPMPASEVMLAAAWLVAAANVWVGWAQRL